MKLVDLEAAFVGGYQQIAGSDTFHHGVSVDIAQGVLFICPKCGSHEVLCWFNNPRNTPKVPDQTFPKPGRWTFTGDSIDTLTLSPSVDLSKIDADNPAHPSRCYWHGFVQNGDAA